MTNWLFTWLKKKHRQSHPEAYMTDAEKMEQLFPLLDKAEKLAAQYTGGYSSHFFSAQEFHAALKGSIAKLKNGDISQLDYLWIWFAPTNDWDELVHEESQSIANEIFSILDDLTKEKNLDH